MKRSLTFLAALFVATPLMVGCTPEETAPATTEPVETEVIETETYDAAPVDEPAADPVE